MGVSAGSAGPISLRIPRKAGSSGSTVIVEEAGGVFTDLNGELANLETRSVLAANPSLHKRLLAELQGYVN